MNFSSISLHSPEIGACQPKVYGDIRSHHDMSTTLHILSTGKYKHHMKDLMRYCSKGIENCQMNVEIKIIMFVIELGVKSIVALYNEGQVYVIC